MSDFNTFKSQFKGDLVTPEHPEYEAALTRWAANSRRRAAIVAFVRDEQDITLALRYARAAGLPIAIRGGGHNPAGASSIEGGLVIDLSRHLNETRVDEEKKLAYVGGGALWRGVNAETAKYGLATTGGTVSHTGVGGLTLGGGFGYLAGEHGLVIDNVVQATVVIADGTVLTANSEENADLFWGLRGGGSNFGVISQFVYKLYPQRATVYSGLAIWPPTALEEIKSFAENWFTNPKDPRSSFMFMLALSPDPSHTPCIIVVPFYNGSEAEGREYFKDLLKIGPMVADMTREMPYTEVNTLSDEAFDIGGNYYLKSVDQARHPDMKTAQKIADSVYSLSKENNLNIMFAWEHWNLDKVNTVPAETTAFQRSPRLGSLVAIQYPEDTPEQLALVRKTAEHITSLVTAAEGNSEVNNGYANYNSDAPYLDDILSEERTRALFGVHHKKLAALKQKYDPDMMFNKWYVIKPAGAAK